jgi:hypothetical protein
MKRDIFAKGVYVQYRDHVGYIDFISDSYFTLCIDDRAVERSHHVCILVYKNQWNDVKLWKESSK